MTTTKITVETCPRDLEEIKKIGRFGLRTMGQELGFMKNGDESQAFLKMTTEQQAEAVLSKLIELDKPAGKASTGAKRTPSNNGKAATTAPKATRAPANEDNDSEQAAPAAAGGNSAAVLSLLRKISEDMIALNEKVDGVIDSVNAVQGNIAGTNKLATVGISLALQVSEQALNAPAEDVLNAAIEQLASIQDTLTSIVTPDEAEEESDEGND